MFQAIRINKDHTIQLIDQRLLPGKELWIQCRDLETVARAIEDMVVRGAPAIGCTAAFGFVVDASDALQSGVKTWGAYKDRHDCVVARLARTRPTAVNLFYAIDAVGRQSRTFSDDLSMNEAVMQLDSLARSLFEDDLRTCKQIGDFGASAVGNDKVNVITHCNTGSLATAGYGTALGVIRSLHQKGRLGMVFVDETRPYLQGSRLTAFELASDGIDHTIIADGAAAYVLGQGLVQMAVVGADRIAMNGDTANKIGTYSLAVNCRHHDVPFYVAAPLATVDREARAGSDIPVEERSGRELTHFREHQVAPATSRIYNPAFDVTPGQLITGIVTEKGVAKPPFTESLRSLF